jgi:hypothetical protein
MKTIKVGQVWNHKKSTTYPIVIEYVGDDSVTFRGLYSECLDNLSIKYILEYYMLDEEAEESRADLLSAELSITRKRLATITVDNAHMRELINELNADIARLTRERDIMHEQIVSLRGY